MARTAHRAEPDPAAVRAVRIHRRADLRVEHVPAPVGAEDEALVRIAYGGICGSDVHYWRDGAVGTSRLRGAMTLGHEIVGTVIQAAPDGSGPPLGQAVAVHPAQTCGTCRPCREGRANQCPHCRYLGSAAQWPHTDGGFAEALAVPTRRLVPVPEELTLRRAVLAEPTAVAWHAVDRAEAVHGSIAATDVLVIGGGPIGLLVTAVAIERGAARTTVVDVHDHPLATARRIGATDTLTAAQLSDRPHPVGADITFEASGTAAGLRAALGHTRRGGSLVMVGQLPTGDLPTPAGLVVASELTVTGSLRIDGELPVVLAHLARAGSALDPLVTDVLPVGEALRAFELAADPARSTKVLLDFGEPPR